MSDELADQNFPPTIFTNRIGVQAGPFEVIFIVSETIVVDEDRSVFRDSLRLAMSPEHALAFRDLLSRQLELFEGKFGQIRKLRSAPGTVTNTSTTKPKSPKKSKDEVTKK